MQTGALAGEGGTFLVTPHETDIDLKSQGLGGRDDTAACPVRVLSLDRNVDVGQMVIALVVLFALDKVDRADPAEPVEVLHFLHRPTQHLIEEAVPVRAGEGRAPDRGIQHLCMREPGKVARINAPLGCAWFGRCGSGGAVSDELVHLLYSRIHGIDEGYRVALQCGK